MPNVRSPEDKVALLELAVQLANVAAACKAMGFSRDSYYRIKKAYDNGGVKALDKKGHQIPHLKKRVATDVECAIIRMSLTNPLLGKYKVSELLEKQGVKVSPAFVRKVWNRFDLTTSQDRMKLIFKYVDRSGVTLNKAQSEAFKEICGCEAIPADKLQADEAGEKDMEESPKFERLISELSALFINLPVDQVDREIERGQRRVCEVLGLHRSLFIGLSEDGETMFITHSWYAPGVTDFYPPVIKNERQYTYVKKMLRSDRLLVFSDREEIPKWAISSKLLCQQLGIESLVIFPLKTGENILGGISWESHGIKFTWTKVILDRLRTISEVFANALSRKRTEMALRNSLAEIKKLKDQLQAENLYLLDEIKVVHSYHHIVGQSTAIKNVLSQVEQVAGTLSTVLILGETGTGKEVLAHAIHQMSSRRDRPMVKVNCSALPATLIESELFGHVKGAYSGAVLDQIGRFEVANGSTIFLDEVGDLPLELQPKLLRVLQDGQFERLGSTKTLTVDVRIIAATNRDLPNAVLQGKFRGDLYYRLNVFPITVPTLRDRTEDIPLLVKEFVRSFSKIMGKNIDTIPNSSIEALKQYDWPGNIRELRNLVERAMIISKGRQLHIPLPQKTSQMIFKIDTLENNQRRHIIQALETTGWRISGEKGAAKLLDINPKTLESQMKRLGIYRAR